MKQWSRMSQECTDIPGYPVQTEVKAGAERRLEAVKADM